jgi:hypothetical protein
MNRPKKLDKYYNWCRRKHHGPFSRLHYPEGCPQCKQEAERKSRGECIAKLGHGPGHQGKTYCDVKGPHKIHHCVFGSYREDATWTGNVHRIKFTGYFDEAPYVKES